MERYGKFWAAKEGKGDGKGDYVAVRFHEIQQNTSRFSHRVNNTPSSELRKSSAFKISVSFHDEITMRRNIKSMKQYNILVLFSHLRRFVYQAVASRSSLNLIAFHILHLICKKKFNMYVFHTYYLNILRNI